MSRVIANEDAHDESDVDIQDPDFPWVVLNEPVPMQQQQLESASPVNTRPNAEQCSKWALHNIFKTFCVPG